MRACSDTVMSELTLLSPIVCSLRLSLALLRGYLEKAASISVARSTLCCSFPFPSPLGNHLSINYKKDKANSIPSYSKL